MQGSGGWGAQSLGAGGATVAWEAQELGTSLESVVPPPPVPGCGEGQEGTQIQDPPWCSGTQGPVLQLGRRLGAPPAGGLSPPGDNKGKD